MNPVRMTITGGAVVAATSILLVLGIVFLPWQDLSSDPSTPILVTAYFWACYAVLWPLAICILFNLPLGLSVFLMPAMVLFWGWVIELILRRRAFKRGQLKSGPSLQG
jgi:hypothetical protein